MLIKKIQGAGGLVGAESALSISYISTFSQDGINQTTYSTTVDCSSITTNDSLIVLLQGESTSVGGNVASLTADGTSMTSIIRESVGLAFVGIYFINGSQVAGDSSVAIAASCTQSAVRSGLIFFRLVNGANATVFDTDSQSTNNTGTLSTVVDFSDPSAVLFATAHFSNGSGHSFTAGIENEYTGIVNIGFGSGDGGTNETPTTSSHTVTFTQNGSTNTQGDSIATAVFTPA